MNDINNNKSENNSQRNGIFKAILSSIIWGSGQVFNKQYLKAFFFSVFFLLLISIELLSGSYFQKPDPYAKIEGVDFSDNVAQNFYDKYQFNVKRKAIKAIPEFDTFYEEASKDGFSNEELYEFLASDLYKNADVTFVSDVKKDEKTGEEVEEVVNIKLKYNDTAFSKEFTKYMSELYSRPDSSYNSTDYTKMIIRVYLNVTALKYAEYENQYDFVVNEKVRFENNFYNFFHDRAGFFVKGIWSILTLGTQPNYTFYQQNDFELLVPSGAKTPVSIVTTIPVYGHQSTYLFLKGLIATLLLMYFLIIYTWNIRDAFKTSKIISETNEIPNEKEYFKDIYDEAFEYIVLLPAIFTITFIAIMPILFSFLIAFTNYDANHLSFVQWVGLKNFKRLATFGGSIPFGREFPRVFAWTLIWAILSTATVYFGGFFQAVILNNSRVIFRKIWRTFLILPWAVPALISQMVFRIMFNEYGVVNSFMKKIGVYDFLFRHNMLGMNIEDVHTFWDKLRYLGTSNIIWINNGINPIFSKAVIIIINIWLGFPFFMALMTGVMTGIDKTLYEAAEMDGATPNKKFRYITFPIVLSTTAPLLIMTFSGNFNNFGVIYFITGGGNGTLDTSKAFAGDMDILITWIYRLTVDSTTQLYNMASVFSILIFLIIGSIAAWNFTRMKAFKED